MYKYRQWTQSDDVYDNPNARNGLTSNSLPTMLLAPDDGLLLCLWDEPVAMLLESVSVAPFPPMALLSTPLSCDSGTIIPGCDIGPCGAC